MGGLTLGSTFAIKDKKGVCTLFNVFQTFHIHIEKEIQFLLLTQLILFINLAQVDSQSKSSVYTVIKVWVAQCLLQAVSCPGRCKEYKRSRRQFQNTDFLGRKRRTLEALQVAQFKGPVRISAEIGKVKLRSTRSQKK